ncbi:MAG: zinc-binding dehydrogenase [Bryobacteraceae bacterium]|nr:zinc-binding dehydrogenase [Bryobacteraceae bacterium]
MKAVQIREHGGPEVLEAVDISEPAPRPDEALIRVRACALNHLDLWVRQGIPGVQFAFPHVLGSDIAGDVVAVGELCRRVRPGMRVLLAPGLSCRQCLRCYEGRDNECREYKLFGAGVAGGYRELMAVPEYAVVPIPEALGYVEAAAAPLVFLTAWHMLFARAGLKPGEEVVVVAASSGVGMAAVQIAKLFHCRVVATAGGEEKMAKARALGADVVVDHYREDLGQELRKATSRRGADVVIEHVGEATWKASTSALAPSGRLVTCGATTGHDVGVDLRFLFAKQQSLLGSYMGTLAELHHVLRYVFEGKLKPVVDSTFPLGEARAAHERLEARRQFGKIVLEV